MALRLAALLTLAVISFLRLGAAYAEEYPCPTDPGFCYLDVASDGCFDGGADVGPINTDLEAGTYHPPTGSIVCPPSVGRLVPVGGINWRTDAGGHVLIYGAKIRATNASLRASGRLLFRGRLLCPDDDISILAEGDVTVDARLHAKRKIFLPRVDITSTQGSIVLAPDSSLSGSRLSVRANNGDITLGSGVRLQAWGELGNRGEASIQTGGDLYTDDLYFSGQDLEMQGNAVTVAGRTAIYVANYDSARLAIRALGSLTIEWMLARAPDVNLRGSSITLGTPDAKGEIQRSRIRVTDTAGSAISLEASSGSVQLTNTKLQTRRRDGWVFIKGNENDISLLDSFVGSPELTLRSGATCDITGTTWNSESTELDCDTLIP